MKSSQKILRKVLKELRLSLAIFYGTSAPEIVLYGSQARGEATESSDIDILLVFPGMVSTGAEIRRLSPVLADLNLRYQVLVSILPISQTEYLRSTGAFWKNVRRDGIPVYAA